MADRMNHFEGAEVNRRVESSFDLAPQVNDPVETQCDVEPGASPAHHPFSQLGNTAINKGELRRETPDASGAHHDRPGLIHALQSLLYGIVVAILIMTFAVQPFRIPSASMEPTLMVGDFVLVAKGDFGGQFSPAPPGNGADSTNNSLHGHARISLLPAATVHRGDVIVFRYPLNPSIHLVKRVIAIPGDRVRMHDNQVFIDGTALHEPYALYAAGPPDVYRDNFPRLEDPNPDVASNWWIRMHTLVIGDELTVPPGEYFVLGDNRNDSEDSRYWGLVPAAAIVGKTVLIYFSLNVQPPGGTAVQTSRETSDRTNARDNALPETASSKTKTPDTGHVDQPQPSGESRSEIIGAIDRFARWNRTLLVVH